MRCVSKIFVTIIVCCGCGEAERTGAERRGTHPETETSPAESIPTGELSVSPIPSPDSGLIERIEIYGLTAVWLEDRAGIVDPDEWLAEAALRVRSEEVQDPPPVVGAWNIDLEEEMLVFVPRYPLGPGLTCELIVTDGAGAGKPALHVFATAPREAGPAAVVTAVYPTRDVLPENQLKFYLHFSAPMSRGQAYEHIRLFKLDAPRVGSDLDASSIRVAEAADSSREEVEDPFLQLAEELWDPAGTRFTLLIDPGRIKRGLKPREEIGPVLEEGGRYALVIEPGWEDANGNPLAERFEKRFRVGPPDETQPAIDRWTIDVPAADSADALVIAFDEPLDRAMLERVLVVQGPNGARLVGEIAVEAQETRWRFTPEQAWAAGEHTLAVDAALEDLAGNSLDRPFEVDVFEKVDRGLARRTVERTFEVK